VKPSPIPVERAPAVPTARPASLHDTSGPDSPAGQALRRAADQAQRVRRAEAARARQRATLVMLMAQTMAELHITMAELNTARRMLSDSSTPFSP